MNKTIYTLQYPGDKKRFFWVKLNRTNYIESVEKNQPELKGREVIGTEKVEDGI